MNGPTGGPLYKIVPTEAWVDALPTVPWAEVDHHDGFVHLSAAHQVRETAAKHFAEHDAFVLLEVDPRRLPPGTLRWDVSRGGDAFPHVYGDIGRAAVVGVDRVTGGNDGRHRFPVHVPMPLAASSLGDALAQRLERAEASALLALARAGRRLGGELEVRVAARGPAVAARFGPSSPNNAVKGWGTGDDDDLGALLAVFDDGESFAIEVPSFAMPAALPMLSARGFRAVAVENCMVRAVDDAVPPARHSVLAAASAQDRPAWTDLLFVAPELRVFGPVALETGLTEAYFILADSERVGACSLRTEHEVAMLTGSAVMKHAQRRGHHLTAIHARLLRAAALGCRYAKLDVVPGSTAHRNACRAGFTLSHTRIAFAQSPAD